MNILEIINQKKEKKALSTQEINYFIKGYTDNQIPDYQISALLMAILLNGMNVDETIALTNAILESGEVIDLSSIKGIKVDKHSTGGVGDKVSLVLASLVASAGASVAKMSGRGLGHTGGTLDKLEAIPNFQITLSDEEFIKQVNEIGVAIIGQSANIVPADKKLYALRDVTSTVDSIPLIASSIMSKKIACGADAILLDVKVGKGAFMQDLAQAEKLADLMVDIGKKLNRNVKAVISDMNQPLGHAIGNSLEVIEAIATLKNQGPDDLTQVVLKIGSLMLMQAQMFDDEKQAYDLLVEKLNDNSAYEKFIELVAAQHGDIEYIKNPDLFKLSKNKIAVYAKESGYIQSMDALELGELALDLGAGRLKKDEPIDYGAGIYLHAKINDYVEENQLLATLYTEKDEDFTQAFLDSIRIGKERVTEIPLIKKVIG